MLVYDIEANGLYEEATDVHCVVAKRVETGEIFRFYDLYDISIEHRDDDRMLIKSELNALFIDPGEPVICHNQLGYDIWMLRKFYGIDLVAIKGVDNCVDTFVWSQALNPDRELPKNCPKSIKMKGGPAKKIGPHGLESWGYRTSKKKPHIEDWSTFTNDMLIRCEEDVLINEMTYYELKKEANL